MMKNIFLSALLLSSSVVYSQLNYLKSGTENSPGIYTDLGTNGTIITTTNFDNANSLPQNIGFAFQYNRVNFTQFILNTNGFIKLGTTNPSTDSLFYTTGNNTMGGVLNSTNPADTNIICIFNHDLKAGSTSPEYRVFTSGLPGSQICTIQFKNVRDKTASPAIQYDNMEFQIKLHETSNTIEFIYGTWVGSATGSSSTKTAAVGLKGTFSTPSQFLVVTKTSSQSWDDATFVSGNYPGSVAFNFGKPASRPAPDVGRIFRFLQAFPNDASINLFTLGSIPNPFGAPRIDSAIIRNIGMDTLKNIVVSLNIAGANTFTDSKNILLLTPGADTTIAFSAYTPTTMGVNNITATLLNDDNNKNNSDAYSQIVNSNIFSYADSEAPTSSIGGNMPSYFVTKYTITGSAKVSGANIFIANNATAIGQKVYAILFDNTSAKLDSSAALIISPADTGKYYNFTFPLSPTITNNSFYVGLAQPTTAINYSPLGYQFELPTRYDAYFITTYLGSPNFADFGGVTSSNPFRLMIQAVLTTTSGIIKYSDDNIVTVYPNPFTDNATFYIHTNDVKNFSFKLYDITGKTVRALYNISTSEFNMDRIGLDNGIYFYSIYSPEKIIYTGKLIIN